MRYAFDLKSGKMRGEGRCFFSPKTRRKWGCIKTATTSSMVAKA